MVTEALDVRLAMALGSILLSCLLGDHKEMQSKMIVPKKGPGKQDCVLQSANATAKKLEKSLSQLKWAGLACMYVPVCVAHLRAPPLLR